MAKIVLGMSGGVDSSIAAWLLKNEGHEVSGISFLMWSPKEKGVCCPLQGTEAAHDTCVHLGISHRTIDMREEFEAKVIAPFVDAYVAGTTPNPCILCNRHIKFPGLLRAAEEEQAEYIATGHYARVGRNGDEFFLMKGFDPEKDQSYVLHVLMQEQLRRLILPLGEYRKENVRKLAAEIGLPAAGRPESQEICFVEERNYLFFMEKRHPVKREPGPIIDQDGHIIGTHKGIHCYTVGQRKGLGVYLPYPVYVTQVDIASNSLFVGPRQAVEQREFIAAETNWILKPFSFPFRCTVKVRSTMQDKPAAVYAEGEDAQICRVLFDEPQWAPAPGQSAVFYSGDVVVGGGTIVRRQA